MIKVEIFPASYGESILVSVINEERVENILIDMGFSNTYENHIKKRLIELKNKNLKIDLLVVTHFDADHIRGAINLINDNGSDKQSNIIKIDDIWINLLKHIEFNKTKIKLNDKEKKCFKKILQKKYPDEVCTKVINDISSSQVITLSQLLIDGKYNINKHFDGKRVECCENHNVVELSNKTKVTILSPTVEKIKKLEELWVKELIKLGIDNKFKDCIEINSAFEKILVGMKPHRNTNYIGNCSKNKDIISEIIEKDLFESDEDEVNGSSISFLLENNKKKLLFLGDSHSDCIETELKKYIKEGEDKIKIDLMKVSHHGSKGNTSKELLDMIDCGKYIISTNGFKFNHPDKEVISRIINSNPNRYKEIIINYETPSIKIFKNKELMKKYNYIIKCTNRIDQHNKLCESTYINL